MRRLAFLPLLLLAAPGCLMKMPVKDEVYSPCRAIDSAGWKAHVERLPATRHPKPIMKPFLIVEGTVTVPEEIDVSLALGPLEKLREPVQEVLVRTVGPAETSGAPVSRAVRATLPLRKPVDLVRIRCGDGTLAVLRDIPTQD
jgi:hypothetical protein